MVSYISHEKFHCIRSVIQPGFQVRLCHLMIEVKMRRSIFWLRWNTCRTETPLSPRLQVIRVSGFPQIVTKISSFTIEKIGLVTQRVFADKRVLDRRCSRGGGRRGISGRARGGRIMGAANVLWNWGRRRWGWSALMRKDFKRCKSSERRGGMEGWSVGWGSQSEASVFLDRPIRALDFLGSTNQKFREKWRGVSDQSVWAQTALPTDQLRFNCIQSTNSPEKLNLSEFIEKRQRSRGKYHRGRHWTESQVDYLDD